MKLDDACSKIGSGATPRGGSNVYQSNGIALIRSQNVYNDGFRPDGLAFISDHHAKELENVSVETGDVLLNITGDSVARVCQVPDEILPARVNQHVAIVRPRSNRLNPRFLRYYLTSPSMQEFMLGLAGAGATRNALTKGMIADFEIPDLPLTEQHAIANILGTLDDKIELNRQINETLEAMARSLFKSWFVDFDPVRAKMDGRQPVGMDAETSALFPSRLVESEIGEVPEGWEVSAIGEEVRVVGGSTPSTTNADFWTNGTMSWATPKDLSALASPVLLETERCITEAGLEQISSGLLPAGTVLLSSRAPIGYLVVSEIPVAINQGFIAMVCDKTLSNHYVRLWAESNMEEIKSQANGTTFLEVSKSSFRPIPVLVPPEPVLKVFTERVGSIHRRVVSNLGESRTLAAVRDALLPKLMSGEVRVGHTMESENA